MAAFSDFEPFCLSRKDTNVAKVVATLQVEDGSKWEQGFQTHADLFKKQTIGKPIAYAVNNNEVTILFEPDDLETYLKILDSAETHEAMAVDGVKRETVEISVLDKEFAV
jgi:hypothetical protein